MLMVVALRLGVVQVRVFGGLAQVKVKVIQADRCLSIWGA